MLPVSNQGVGDNVGFPDTCNTPSPSGTTPITYPNDGSNATSLPFAATVLVSLVPGHNQTSKPAITNGDNAGVAHSSFMQSGGNNCGNPMVLMTGAPSETLANPTQGNNYNCSLDAKLVPSLVNVLASFHAPAGGGLLAELLDAGRPSLGLTLDGDRVVHVRRGGLAARAGARAGDRLRALEGALLPGEQVRLRLQRGAESLRRAARATSTPAPVAGRREGDLGWLVVRRCSVGAPRQAARVLARLVAGGARRLVLDLRGNPGGLLAAATDLAGLFLPAGTPVVHAAQGRERRTYLTGEAAPCALPLTVLVDGGTASAAEVLAAALRDTGRAALAGSPTHGKLFARRLVGGPSARLWTAAGRPLATLEPAHAAIGGR